MRFVADRPYADPDAVARKIVKLAHGGDRVSLITRGGYDWTKPKLSNR
jgi:hypothetical protein